MARKTVSNVAGLVFSRYLRAIKGRLVTTIPVTHSDLPQVKKRSGLALLPSERDDMVGCAVGPGCVGTFLGMVRHRMRRGEGEFDLRRAGGCRPSLSCSSGFMQRRASGGGGRESSALYVGFCRHVARHNASRRKARGSMKTW
jgi:hypothetical protein